MTPRASNSGTCALCGQLATKTKMVVHLEACVATHDIADSAQELVRLRIDDAYDPRYWIQVEMRADAPLQYLDSFLRQLWLVP